MDIEIYSETNGGGTLIKTEKIAGGNELNGTDGGSGMSVSSHFTLIIPSNAKSLVFVKGAGGRDPVVELTSYLQFSSWPSGSGIP